MKKSVGTTLLTGACLLAASSLSTLAYGEEEGRFDRAIEYRQSVMNLFAWNVKPMGAMLKGKVPYDSASFTRHAKDLAAVASVDLMSGFPEDSDAGETDALADIWLDFNDFQEKYKNLQIASQHLSDAVSGSDKDKIQAAFTEVGKACKACHKAYKN